MKIGPVSDIKDFTTNHIDLLWVLTKYPTKIKGK